MRSTYGLYISLQSLSLSFTFTISVSDLAVPTACWKAVITLMKIFPLPLETHNLF